MTAPEPLAQDTAATAEYRVVGRAERYADWLARRERGKGRQATISRNLASLTSYRTWAQKVRENWEPDSPAAIAPVLRRR
jgi:hypothetical protein